MRTQGDVTVILIYSYNQQGQPVWRIASGQFDQSGRFQGALVSTGGGSEIVALEPVSAQIQDSSDVLEIQLDGFQLGTISLNGGSQKTIQSLNFGTPVFTTEHVTVINKPFAFPDLMGQWVLADYQSSEIKAGIMNLAELSGMISPLPPTNPRIYAGNYDAINAVDSIGIDLACLQNIVNGDLLPYCEGTFQGFDGSKTARVYFEDMGYHRFRIYVDSADDLSRASPYLDFFRMPEY